MAHTSIYIFAQHINEQPFFKVGIASDLDKRMAQLQTGSPHEIMFVEAISCPTREVARALERHAHGFLAEFRVKGEWFRCEYKDIVGALPAAFYVSQKITGWTDFDQIMDLCGFPKRSAPMCAGNVVPIVGPRNWG